MLKGLSGPLGQFQAGECDGGVAVAGMGGFLVPGFGLAGVGCGAPSVFQTEGDGCLCSAVSLMGGGQ